MRNMKVSKKLAASFFIVILLTTIVGLIGIVGMMSINAGSNEMYRSQAQPLSDLGMAREYFQRLRVQLRDVVLASGDTASLDYIEVDVYNHTEGFLTHMDAYRHTITAPEMIELFDEIMAAFYEYQRSMPLITASARANAPPVQMLIMMENMREPADFIVEGLSFLTYVRVMQATDLSILNDYRFTVLFIIIIFVIVTAIIIAAFLAEYIMGGISKPLRAIGVFANKVSTGEIDVSTVSEYAIDVHSEDEIGKLARILERSYIQLSEYERSKLEAESASRAKSSFLSKMSHEIRTPLNAILGMAELTLRDDISDATRKKVATIKHSGGYLLSILNDILNYSKIETGKMKIVDAPYSFYSMINDVISIIKVRMADSKLKFGVYIDSSVPNRFIGDDVRLRQVLLNILVNAFKYTKEGRFSLEITGEEGVGNAIILTMKVSDTGQGISEENMENLFGEFTQFDGMENRYIEGIGLGLAISKNLLTLMDGTIEAQSEYGKGSEFTIRVPQICYTADILKNAPTCENEKALLYCTTPIHEEYTVRAFNDLRIEHQIVSDNETLKTKLLEKKWTVVFAEENLAYDARKIIDSIESSAQLVMISENHVNEDVSNMAIISTPIYFFPIFNLLTGKVERSSLEESESKAFIAPTANVMVVDDVELNLLVCEGMLKPFGVAVTLCTSGFEAIKELEIGDYDLVLMDHMMPDMDGIETTRQIRLLAESRDKKYSNLPIIALTANTVFGAREMFLRSGFNDFISKPIDVADFNNVMRKWIPKEKQEQDDMNR